jgi:hypothetical protein
MPGNNHEQTPNGEGFVTREEFEKLGQELAEIKQSLENATIALNAIIAERDALRAELNELKRANGMPVDEDAPPAEDDDFEVIVHNQDDPQEQPTVAHNITEDTPNKTKKKFNFSTMKAIGVTAVASIAAVAAFATFGGKKESDNVKADTITQTANSNQSGVQANSAAVTLSPELKSQLTHKLNGSVSIGEASKAIGSDSGNIKSIIKTIYESGVKINLDHNKHAMSSVIKNYGPGQIDAINAAEVVALSSESSDSYTAGLYNAMHNRHVHYALPSGVTIAQARQYVESIMTANGTKFSIERPHGIFENHGMIGEHRFDAGNIYANGNVTMFVITDANGHKTYIKTSNECFNIMNQFFRGHAAPVQGGANVPSVIPSGPTPGPHPGPKFDKNNTPAGVPGEPRGSGGNGPEPTRPHAGKAPSSVYQPQTPKPTHVPNSGHSNQPAETGVDHGKTGPATKGNGTENPAGQINSGNVPAGD